jgi:hypothetical protein
MHKANAMITRILIEKVVWTPDDNSEYSSSYISEIKTEKKIGLVS